MYTSEYVYIESTSNINAYTVSEIQMSDIQYKDINTNVFLAVTDKSKKIYILDYSRMMRDYNLGVSTWSELDKALTNALVLGYATDLPGFVPGTANPRNPVVYWDALTTLNTFNLDYGDYLTGRYNIYAYRWMLHDLRMSIQPGATKFPNLERCIPIVNGFTCRPVYDKTNKALYALGGAKLCWHDNGRNTPEVQLLDFTDVGDVDIISIKDQDHFEVNSALATGLTTSHRLVLTFNKYSTDEYTPIIVLGGILVLPDQYKLSSNHRIIVDVNKLPLNKALPLRQMLEENPVTKANVIYQADDPRTHLLQAFASDLSADTFIIFVHTSRIYVNKYLCDVWRNGITIDIRRSAGLLINEATHTVKNYHRDMYSDRAQLTTQSDEVILVDDASFDKEHLSMVDPDCQHHSFQNINNGRCIMIQMLGD